MWLLYDWIILPVLLAAFSFASLFNKKIHRGLRARRTVLREVREYYATLSLTSPRLLIHISSFGELEQAKPVLELLRKQLPDLHIHVTFFSPSGYENAKAKYTLPDFISYLPFDMHGEIESFIEITRPDLILITRYDVWPNFVRVATERHIPVWLFAATLSSSSKRERSGLQVFNRMVYRMLDRIYTIGESDRERFTRMGVKEQKCIVGGDTRYDQVLQRRRQAVLPTEVVALQQRFASIERENILVAGSTWEEDLTMIAEPLLHWLTQNRNRRLIIAPHEPSASSVALLEKKFRACGTIRLSSIDRYANEQVVIADSIGKLFSLYAMGETAYVGGGFSDGVHNILEPAVYGAIPVVGPNHTRSQEIADFIASTCAFEINDAASLVQTLHALEDQKQRRSIAERIQRKIEQNAGASEVIARAIDDQLKKSV